MGSSVVLTDQGTWEVWRDADLLSCGEHLREVHRTEAEIQ